MELFSRMIATVVILAHEELNIVKLYQDRAKRK